MTKKLEKKFQLKKLYIFLINNCNLPNPSLQKRTSCHPDTDPVTCFNPDPIRIRNTGRNPCESEDTAVQNREWTNSPSRSLFIVIRTGLHKVIVKL
jgi:hypothetical protein